MRAFLTWWWKEWRDQRAVLLGVFVAIPALTVLAFLAFGRHLDGASADSLAVVFLPASVGLFVLAIAGDLFASEARRGTLAMLRRVPGAMGRAFGTKIALLLLGAALVLLWQVLVLEIVWDLRGPHPLPDALGPLEVHLWEEQAGMFVGGALVLGMWMALASTWLAHGGVALLLAPLLLGAACTPAILLVRQHPWVVAFAVSDAGVARVLFQALPLFVALLAAAASFLRGGRLQGSAWRGVWRGMAVVVVASGAVLAFGAIQVHEGLDLDPHAADFRVSGATVSADGRRLYVEVWREAKPRGGSDPQATPLQVWEIEVATGVRRVLAAPGYVAWPAWETGFAVEPWPILRVRHVEGDQVGTTTWIDTRTGTVRAVLPSDLEDARTRTLVREGLLQTTSVRDAPGRRCWLLAVRGANELVLEREGEDHERLLRQAPRVGRLFFPVDGGWFGHALGGASDGRAWRFVDATSGTERHVRPRRDVSLGMGQKVLSPERYLSWEERDGTSMWVVGSVAEGVERPAVNAPGKGDMVCAIDRRHALVIRRAGERAHLALWDPLTGEDLPVSIEGRMPPPLDGVGVWGRMADGRRLLRMGGSWAVLSVDGPRVRVLMPHEDGDRPIALLTGDVLIVQRDGRLVVRHDPETGTSEVIFPR